MAFSLIIIQHLKNFRSKEFIYYSTPLLVLMLPVFYYIYVASIQYRSLALKIFNNTRVVLKSAVENPDGSYDVVLNIPESSERLAELLRRGRLNPEVECRGQYVGKVPKRTLYPLTSNSPYVINNPSVCTNVSNLKFLIIVHSATENFQRRRIIRETWANKNVFTKINLRIVFLFGLTKVKATQELIENESIVYGDVVQGNFLDTYHNLTHKGVLAYRWTQDFCQQAEMIVKVDDDMFLNVFILLEKFYPKFKSKNRSISCHYRKKGTSPIVRGASKWHVDEHLFRGYSHYPTNYCNGYLVLISRDIIRPMYRASFLTPFFWVDDVYLYGLLPDKVGNVKHEDIRSNMTLNSNLGLKCYTEKKNCTYLAVNTGNKQDVVEKLWYAVLSQLSPAMKKEINPILLS
ncbi:beta-1,3-galactosyltransferase 1-like [Gigantopelta aegis]|uniref:beta-1,3-galactosyltransferase 1-like n=1 Tax=Gigantopelta aegis TaxID=1735272 RepID=UPI001B88DD0A|nr:beta-1,3-galactosyltransferase 1-like [Gigantopelta aegis]